MKLYTSRSDKKGRILGKRKPFRLKQKMLRTESNASDTMEQPAQYRNAQK
jgi:hypothetical protein